MSPTDPSKWSMESDDLVGVYRAYLAACNKRDWDTIAFFVHPSVLVNGVPRTRQEYVADLRRTIAIFPDYTWHLRHTVVQPPWLAVHLHNTGTRHAPFLDAPGDQTPVRTDEFAMYRIVDQQIAELWGTADNARLRQSPEIYP